MLKRDLKWGLGLMTAIMVIAAIIATLQYMLSGSDLFAQIGVSYRITVLLYAVIAGLGGIALGLLRPLLRSRAGAAFVGFVVALLAYGPIGLVIDADVSLATNLLTSALIALLVGVPGGIYFASSSSELKDNDS